MRDIRVAVPVRQVALGSIVESMVDGPFGSNLKSSHYIDRPEVRVIRLQNIGQSRFLDEDRAYVSIRHAATLQKHSVRAGDLLVASMGDPSHPVARTCQYPPNLGPAIVKADCFRIRLKSEVSEPAFVRWYLNSAEAALEAAKRSQGVTRDRINLSLLREFSVSLPPLREQRRIAEILDTVDESIRSTERTIAKLSAVRIGLINGLLTSHTEAWESRNVENWGLVTLGRQRSPSSEQGSGMTPYLRVANVFDGWIDYTDVNSMNFSQAERERYWLRNGDVLLNEGQSLELVGRCAMYEGPDETYCFQNTLVRFRTFSELLPEFAHLTFSWWQNVGRFVQIAKQTTSIAHLGADRFAKICLRAPDIDSQRAMCDIVRSQSAELASRQAEHAKLRLIKQGLMEDLLTGRVRVSVD